MNEQTMTQDRSGRRGSGRRTRALALAASLSLALGGLALGGGVAPTSAHAAGIPGFCSGATEYDYTGGAQCFQVPAGVTRVTFDVYGAQGGRGAGHNSAGGGLGGEVRATLSVTPYQIITVDVGGKGGDASGGNPNNDIAPGGAGGYNGGGTGGANDVAASGDYGGGGGGGGRSDIWTGGTAVGNRVLIVAGGGGGGGGGAVVADQAGSGGAGGGQYGGDGNGPTSLGSDGIVCGGGPGVGGGGDGCSTAVYIAGTGGSGGNASSNATGPGGGGGGAGYYGGSAGDGAATFQDAGGGGGGSGYAFADAPSLTSGVEAGNGKVLISYPGAVNDTDPGITYSGRWGYYGPGRGLGDYQDDVHATARAGDSFGYTFTGTGITYLSEVSTDEGMVDIYVDGRYKGTVNCRAGWSNLPQQGIYSISGLPAGRHTLKVVNDTNSWMLLDALIVAP